MRAVFLAALLLASSSVFAQTARVSGIVVEEGTNNPVVGARIMLIGQMRPTMVGGMPQQPPSTTTNEQGQFLFEGLPAGSYSLNVVKATFVPSLSNARASTITVMDGEARDDLRFQLQRGGVIAGRVLDTDGQPLVEARVSALRETATGQMPRLMPNGPGVQTNDLGEFRLYGLASGDYIVQVTPRVDGGMLTRGVSSERTATGLTYYPSAADPASAQTVSVAPGQTTRGVYVSMRRVPVFTVSGIVVDESGAPAPGAIVTVFPNSGNVGVMMAPPRGAPAGADGTFTISGVAPGQYTLSASIQPVFPDMPAGNIGAVSGGFVTGSTSSGGGITTQTRNGVTVQYRTPEPARIPVAVTNADVSGMQVVAPRPQIINQTP